MIEETGYIPRRQRRRPQNAGRKDGRPPYTIEQILTWADAHQARTGQWPRRSSGRVAEAPEETWEKIETALTQGYRGLPGGASLTRLLAEHRGVESRPSPTPLTVEQILKWADEYYQRTGRWPSNNSGPVAGAPGERWLSIDNSLVHGRRGLPGGSSLSRLLAEHRGRRPAPEGPRSPLAISQILEWADAYRRRYARWPTVQSGLIPQSPGETWQRVDYALRQGLRGLPGSSSLAQLIRQHEADVLERTRPRLTEEQILAWADAHRERQWKWPTRSSGPVKEAISETWAGIDAALRQGYRGLPGGSSLARLLAERRPGRQGQ